MTQPPVIDHILSVGSSGAFDAAALDLFRYQSLACGPYRDYLRLVGVDPAGVEMVDDIPFLPIELFKSHRVYCGRGEAGVVFTSSTTSGGEPSRHYMEHPGDYEKTFVAAFTRAYGDPAGYSFYSLLPGYLQREGSSLICMMRRLTELGGRGGFFLDRYGELLDALDADPRPKILLGVSYALWDMAETAGRRLPTDTIVMETGGMKGHRDELPRGEFHDMLCRAFGVQVIHSEYGMAELTSQCYSRGSGLFTAPPWVRVVTREVNDPFSVLHAGQTGGVNIIDLGNLSSCAFLQTQDLGTVNADGTFTIEGRIDHSAIRGCNLLVQ